jgi:hypothetical protein
MQRGGSATPTFGQGNICPKHTNSPSNNDFQGYIIIHLAIGVVISVVGVFAKILN